MAAQQTLSEEQLKTTLLKLIFLILLSSVLLLSSAASGSTLHAAQSAPTPTVEAGKFVNPVLDQDFPDPDVLKVGDSYYAYATNGNGFNIQVSHSTDLVHWSRVRNAFMQLPKWAVPSFGWTWAPDVSTPDGGKTYLMYFVDRFAIGEGGTQCIGAATADKPDAYFHSVNDKPFICQVDQGGSIDPASFVDEDGTPYVLWKNDGNSGGGQTWLYIQRVSADGLTLQGEPTRLITADQGWEGPLVEAPTLWKHGGKYYLFYSANAYNNERYAVGYAVSNTIFGPYQKPRRPLLATDMRAGLVGPGGQDIVLDAAGNTWLMYHNWASGGYRRLNLSRLDWVEGVPVVQGLTRDPQPAPEMTLRKTF